MNNGRGILRGGHRTLTVSVPAPDARQHQLGPTSIEVIVGGSDLQRYGDTQAESPRPRLELRSYRRCLRSVSVVETTLKAVFMNQHLIILS